MVLVGHGGNTAETTWETMTEMNRFYFFPAYVLILTVLPLTGCGRGEVPDPPLAQCELTVRLLESLSDGRYPEALKLIEKCRAIDSENLELAEMHSRILGNLHILKCNEALRDGGVDAALAVIRAARKEHPLHPRLRAAEEELLRLQELEAAAAELAAAQTPETLTAALTGVEPLAAAYPAAAPLRIDIATRRLELAQMREKARENRK